ncbi:uncharacterized protein I303_101877 [Kwoniella dejecticola CBS 10117]|uniref:DUF1264-domain-containing protein n=1 Tax=Kwoniella dejecticola CBS 10117 TaxID=1296121 RepID=A0A1A6ACI8_9TREE|nr:uncharacterized protein I303_01986 [Kwoniella dejecticola CBS 10117]OBR87774.1 hypothetical protein I303_01986 [Kwoniella dejecticola CBS 10117]
MPRDQVDKFAQAEHSGYHSSAYMAAGEAQMSFTPINQIHQHLCGLHIYSHDGNRAVKAHHYCTHLRKDLHQCVIYDSDQANARLIGIEYLVPEEVFISLPEDEKKYWHSHKYEVDSGMLMLGTKSLVPNAMTDIAERPSMLELHRTYGKTTHTWAYDRSPDLPLGPPQIMMAYTEDSQVDKKLLAERDNEMGVDTAAKKETRRQYLIQENLDRPPAEGADQIWTNGRKGQLEWVDQK